MVSRAGTLKRVWLLMLDRQMHDMLTSWTCRLLTVMVDASWTVWTLTAEVKGSREALNGVQSGTLKRVWLLTLDRRESEMTA